MTDITVQIRGMSCGHCVGQIRKILARLGGVHVHEVTVGQARVSYDKDALTLEELFGAIRQAGYEVETAGRVA